MSPLPKIGEAIESLAVQLVTNESVPSNMICNLLYRRFVIGRTQDAGSRIYPAGAAQNAILRYSRLQIILLLWDSLVTNWTARNCTAQPFFGNGLIWTLLGLYMANS